LTIAGLDPSGGAGIIADIKTFFAFGCFPTAAVASLTFQNTLGVFGAEHQTAGSVGNQVQPIIDDLGIDAMKTGMLPTREVISETVAIIRENGLRNIVVDPVVRSTSGFDLIDNEALRAIIEDLFPLADLITPNIPEAERMTGIAIESDDDIVAAAKQMREFGARNVLIKGGHRAIAECGLRSADSSEGRQRSAVDFLFLEGELQKIEAPFIETTAMHGTGCTLAAAITANLALGKTLKESVEIAKAFVHRAIVTAPGHGKGNSPINIKPI
jgi:hydroxymethylpyrimidine kinase/phosphomethylpyrimidine kinase